MKTYPTLEEVEEFLSDNDVIEKVAEMVIEDLETAGCEGRR